MNSSMRTLLTTVTSVAALCLGGCDAGDGDMLFLRNRGADMPVWVRGDGASDVLILAVHGGPGGSSFTLFNAPPFQRLEARYGVAYWEQRASGMAQGHADTSTLTVAQFREDLGLVVDLLHRRYPTRKLYLLGYSWGGLLTAEYLADASARGKVRGWIDAAGSVDVPLTLRLGRDWAVTAAERRAREGDRDAADALDWYRANPAIDRTNITAHLSWVSKLGGGSTTGRSAVNGAVIFDSPFDPFTFSANASHTLDVMFPQIERENAAPSLRAVTVPALILAGEADGQVPAGVSDEVFASLGTPDADKEIVHIPAAAHALHLDAPDAYAERITRFIERTR